LAATEIKPGNSSDQTKQKNPIAQHHWSSLSGGPEPVRSFPLRLAQAHPRTNS
jgi:hypothetical protein